MGIELLYRQMVLSVAGHPRIRGWMEKRGMAWGVRRFVAGNTLAEALEQVRRLNKAGLMATLDYLGESVYEREQVTVVREEILRMLEELDRLKLQANVSLKLSQLGLMIDESLCLEQMEVIVGRARQYGGFVRIDMEDSSLTDATLRVFTRLLAEYGREHVGTVIQSYLYRSYADVDCLSSLRANLRIVKGAYKEPREIAYASKKDVDDNYFELVRLCLDRKRYVAVATHDRKLIERVIRYAKDKGVAPDRFEFQMLYGIAGQLQLELAAKGYRVRVYTPYGEQWYPYFSRRIAERPANLWFVIKGLLRR
jgi:proline dehydrogenase